MFIKIVTLKVIKEMMRIYISIEFKKNNPLIPVIIISGHGTVDMAVNAIKNGAYDFLEKPFNPQKLLDLSFTALKLYGKVVAPTTINSKLNPGSR